MHISIRDLKRIVVEAVRKHERYVPGADAEEMIASADGDAIVPYDIIDEETGEVYLKAGDAYNESPFSPDHRVDRQRAQRDEEYAKRVGLWDELHKPDEDDDDEEDYFDKLDREEREAQEEWREACKEYATNWQGWAYEHVEEYGEDVDPDQAAQGSASDAADGFFHEYADWRRWARAMRMSRTDMKEAIADFVYDAMMKK